MSNLNELEKALQAAQQRLQSQTQPSQAQQSAMRAMSAAAITQGGQEISELGEHRSYFQKNPKDIYAGPMQYDSDLGASMFVPSAQFLQEDKVPELSKAAMVWLGTVWVGDVLPILASNRTGMRPAVVIDINLETSLVTLAVRYGDRHEACILSAEWLKGAVINGNVSEEVVEHLRRAVYGID